MPVRSSRWEKSVPPASASRSSATTLSAGSGVVAGAMPVSSIVSRIAAIRAAASGQEREWRGAISRASSSIRPPGKTKAPAAKAMASERSIIRISGGPPIAESRITMRVAAGIAGGRSSSIGVPLRRDRAPPEASMRPVPDAAGNDAGDVLHIGDVDAGIGGKQEQVGALARRDQSAVGEADGAGILERRRPDRLERRQPGALDQQPHFL